MEVKINSRNRLLILVLSLPLIFCPSCFSQEKSKHSLKVAVLLKSSTNPFFSLMWEGIKSEADRLHMTVDLFWPENESNFEYQYNFLKKDAFRYDVLIVAPSNPDGVSQYLPPLKQAKKTILILDIDFHLSENERSKYYDVFIGTDDTLGGMLAADFAKPYLSSKQQVLILKGFEFHKNIPRLAAFRDRIRTFYPNVKFIEYAADYDRKKASKLANDHLGIFLRSPVIYCANDHMALGVLDILSAQKITKLPVIIGYDSIREAQQAILEGNLAASVTQFPARMGSEAVKAIESLIMQKEAVPQRILIKPELSVRKVSIESVTWTDADNKIKQNEIGY